MIDKCPICKSFLYEWKEHFCPPRWECFLLDYGDENEPDEVFSNGDEGHIAEIYAENNFSNWDYPRSMEIWVRKDSNHEWKKFEVDVQSVPSFTASEVGNV